MGTDACLYIFFDSWMEEEYPALCVKSLSEKEKSALTPQLYRGVEVKLHIETQGDGEDGRVRARALLGRLLNFLTNVGEFVLSLRVDLDFNELEYPPPRLLEEWNGSWRAAFRLVPNLRELVFTGFFPCKCRHSVWLVGV